MPEHGGPPWGDGPPPWTGPGGFRPGAGRRFRRGVLVAFLLVVVLVALLARLVTWLLGGNPPAPGVTVVASALVLIALVLVARWLWRNGRSVGMLMDAAGRVAGGEYDTRVGEVPARQLRDLAGAFDAMTERLASDERRRRELLADVAHELRTPLQAIRGSIEGMLDGLYPSDADHLRPVLDRTELMAHLLDDLRTLSMAEAGVLELHRETMDPRAVAQAAATAFDTAASERGVRLEVDAAPGTPATIEADPVRVQEILTNLLANAIRYTPRDGSVTVHVDAAPGGAAFTVADTGPGIPPERLPTVFDRFVTSADAGGTGLGLAIAKRLTEAHGGTIAANSPPGGGTSVRFEIPG
ncbi:MAG TPA: HAMP domain-containing sensor histidine kinase [Actinomycetota bacterium]|nr:HAMP domain-containing sensor histidine kinase [Actinomycetota bacterium]